MFVRFCRPKVLTGVAPALLSDKTHEETLKKRQAERMEQRLTNCAGGWSRLTLIV